MQQKYVGLNPTKTIILYTLLFLLLSNAVSQRRDKSILYSKQITSVLLFLLLLGLFLYLIFSYVLGWNHFSLHLNLALILLLRLIDYTSNFYYIKITRIGIKPYSRVHYILEVFIDIALYLSRLIILIKSILTLIMSPVNSLLSAIFIKIKGIIISTFTSTPYYKTLKGTYYKGGLFSLLNKLATLIYYRTTDYIHHNLYYMIGFQCVCIYQALLGYELWLIISLLHMIIHLPFFIISIGTYITIINRNFYKQYPLLFSLYSCACLLLFLVLIVLSVILYGLISHQIDDYFIQAKGNDGGNAGSPGPGPGPGPKPGPNGGDPGPSDIYPDPSKKKGKQKEENTEAEHIPHVNRVMDKYIQKAKEILEDKDLSVREQRYKLDELKLKRNQLSSKSSSSYSDEEALKQDRYFLDRYSKVAESGLTELNKKNKNLAIMAEENSRNMYKKKIADIGSAGHNRNFKSADESSAKTFTKGIPKDYTSPDLGGYERSQRFEEKPRQPMGLDGSRDYEEKTHGDLEIPIGQGLEPALADPVKAPEVSTRIEDIEPDINPISSQRGNSNISPFSNISSPPATPSKRDRIKNLFKKKK